jgi:hypothetical protein
MRPMARHSKRKPKPRRKAPKRERTERRPALDLDELWQRVRAGAATVAGVRYQLAVSAFLLAGARGHLELEELTPEGLEDVDCRLNGGSRLLVQAKDRAAGAGRFGPAELRSALEHAKDALRLDQRARFAVITDAELTAGLAETSFDRSVAEALPDSAARLLEERDAAEAAELKSALTRSHLIRLEWLDVHEEARRRIEASYELPPVLAGLAHVALLEELSAAASDQRLRQRESALRLRPSDLDALVQRLRAIVDVDGLMRAEREGLIAAVDFTRPIDLPPERFLLGVDVEPGHIAAGLDVVRAGELEQIFAGLRDDQYVVIAGPSGAGKSALLWRAAYELGGRFRLLRLRQAALAELPELVRYIEAQRPSAQAPLLVCGDDVGRPALAAWEDAVDRLLELPGVHILGAVREEDFRASLLRGRARVIRPVLDRRLANEVVAQLERRDTAFALEFEEAFSRADGLLMEFLALLIEGRRLRDIVNAQVEERLVPERTAEREVLRHVCTAHSNGVALPATALTSLPVRADQLPAALRRLEDEFLLRHLEGDRWVGLHELRSRAVANRLHDLPPPSEGQTLGVLLRLVGHRDKRTLIVAAALGGHDLAPLMAAAKEVLASNHLDAAGIYDLLDGFVEAEELVHARACLWLVRERAPMLDAVSVLPLLQMIKDGWVDSLKGLPSGEAIDELAASLPARPQSLAAAAASHLPEPQLEAAVAASPPREAVRLLELLAFLGRRLAIEPVCHLIEHARVERDIETWTRAVGALAQATPESVRDLTRIAGPLEARLDAIANARGDILGWRVSGLGRKQTVRIEASEYGEGRLNDRLVGICRLVYDGCPELEQVTVIALAADGSKSVQPDAEKSPTRRYVLNPIRDIRRNVAFDEALHRLTAADSWSERLRRHEVLVGMIETALEDAIPRLLNPHDNTARIRDWLEIVDRIRAEAGALLSVPLPASASVDRTDRAKGVLDRLSLALTQLGEAVATNDLSNLLGIGSQLQSAFGRIEEATEGALGASTEMKEWPLVQRLLVQLERLRAATDLAAGLLLALEHDRSLLRQVPRRKGETWRDVARDVIERTRGELLAQERVAIEDAVVGLGCDLRLVSHQRPGEVRPVNDRWLLVSDFEQWQAASERLLSLPGDVQLAVGFRAYTSAAVEGVVLPVFTRMLGSLNSKPFLYPVGPEDAVALAEQAGVDHLRSPVVDEALAVFGLIGEASHLAACYRLRDGRFSREIEREAAVTALEKAREALERVTNAGVRSNLFEALRAVEAELGGSRSRSLAAEMQEAAFKQEDNRASRLAAAVIVAAVDAALREPPAR